MNDTLAWCLLIIFAAIIIGALVTAWDDQQRPSSSKTWLIVKDQPIPGSSVGRAHDC